MYKILVKAKVESMRKIWRINQVFEIDAFLKYDILENYVIGGLYKEFQKISNNPKGIFLKITELEITRKEL